jgi:Tfp pilus assembly protein PilF
MNPNWRDRAEENFQIALGKDPCDVAALVGLGELYIASGKRGMAMSMFTQALALDPDNEDLKRRMGDRSRKATWKKMLGFWKN